ncbi:Elongator complex protein 4 [Rhynchospora pubera]|uniref:Elongator complex protein 4 n=1 Tax=Rhynchospora pubera TaxID=906938 RepID=A0AAV8G6Q0_9POAL|nr:Elongator complex protein 4 [Rhynchospora pubera]
MATGGGQQARPTRPSSFSRVSSSSFSPVSSSSTSTSLPPGVRIGANGAAFVSSGIPDLDRILGGGFLVGSVVMVMEDADAPHHLLLLRNFMSQGIVHGQSVLFAGPTKEPRSFLGTLPSPVVQKEGLKIKHDVSDVQDKEKGLRIAWQYKKYFGEQTAVDSHNRDKKQEFSSDFDLRKPLERQLLNSQNIACISTQDAFDLSKLQNHCLTFVSKLSMKDGINSNAGRIAIQSLCAPQCGYFEKDWDMLSFIRSLRATVQSSNAVAVITFPASVLSNYISKRWQHLADTLLSVRAIPDEDKDLAKLLTGYQDMLGFLHVHKVAQFNSQVPVILDASTYSLKLQKKKSLVLERLNQAPVEGSSGVSYATSGSCSSSKGSLLDF